MDERDGIWRNILRYPAWVGFRGNNCVIFFFFWVQCINSIFGSIFLISNCVIDDNDDQIMDTLTKVHEDLTFKLWKNSVIKPHTHLSSIVYQSLYFSNLETNHYHWKQRASLTSIREAGRSSPLHGPYRGTGLRAWMRNHHHQHRVTFRETNVGYVVSPPPLLLRLCKFNKSVRILAYVKPVES